MRVISAAAAALIVSLSFCDRPASAQGGPFPDGPAVNTCPWWSVVKALAGLPDVESSRLRIFLDDEAAVARRFVAFAAMSALAYQGGDATDLASPRDAEVWDRLTELLRRQGWALLVHELVPSRQDETGLFFRVWVRDEREIAIAFRGTDGLEDLKSNGRWLLRWGEDQYPRARQAARRLVETATEELFPGRELVFYTTGHSLGGGLAQHVLYDQPGRFLQAIVFNSSPVTGEKGFSKEQRREACSCRPQLGAESRIYQINESAEFLAAIRGVVRGWGGMSRPLRRHQQSLTFRFSSNDPFSQHSINQLALNLLELAGSDRATRPDWYVGSGACAGRFEDCQRKACEVSRGVCPF
ncbi:MAG: hypothetical protein GY769_19000 [bacterium]|nr:hypothetical protein [bacterium]